MTRYTNLGRKRTFLEAGFGDASDRAADDVENEPVPGTSANPSNDKQSKKRKRTKPKQSKEDEPISTVTQHEGDGMESRDGESSQEVKNAYANRDENRKKEADRTVRSEQRRIERIKEKRANTTCFACRQKGHPAKECPNTKTGDVTSNKRKAINSAVVCYRCGSSKHTLSRCKKPENPNNPLPYASCYVCSGKGHIASSCPQNQDKGIYPNGGCCKLCGEKTHLARNCPTRQQLKESSSLLVGTGQNAGADEDDFHSFKRVNAEVEVEEQEKAKAKAKKKKVDVSVGTMGKAVKSLAMPPPATTKKKVVVF